MTKHQIELMTEKSIIPVNVVELCVDDDEIFRRATQDRRSPSRYENMQKCIMFDVIIQVKTILFGFGYIQA